MTKDETESFKHEVFKQILENGYYTISTEVDVRSKELYKLYEAGFVTIYRDSNYVISRSLLLISKIDINIYYPTHAVNVCVSGKTIPIRNSENTLAITRVFGDKILSYKEYVCNK